VIRIAWRVEALGVVPSGPHERRPGTLKSRVKKRPHHRLQELRPTNMPSQLRIGGARVHGQSHRHASRDELTL